MNVNHLKSKIVICVRDSKLLKELSDLAKHQFEVIGCTDPRITAESIVPSEIFAFVADNCALLRRSRLINEKGHRILVTDYSELDDIVDNVNNKTVHHIVNIPVRAQDFLSALTIIYPPPPLFSGKSIRKGVGGQAMGQFSVCC